MRHNELLDSLHNLIKIRPKQREIAEILNCKLSVIGNRATRNSNYPIEDIKTIGEYYHVDLFNMTKKQDENITKGVIVKFRPDVYLSAGYGVEVYNEDTETMVLDERIFFTDKGTKINPENCEIVTISGNSMAPEYRHGDRVIIDKSVQHFIDGHIFAFKYNGECFIKEICLLGKRVKAIPLNSDYDSFFIDDSEDVVIFGRILPRVRL